MSFLGPSQLLFTFNPHALTARTGNEARGSQLHSVRAVLLNLATGKVERTVDWRVRDHRQYLWPMDGSRVLVHVGDQLKMLGPGLQEEASLDLPGPVAFLTHSPDRKHLAVGVVHELHTEAMHKEIEATTSGEPEEEVETLLLNERLQGSAVGTQSSRFRGPVLSDDGEIVLTRAGKSEWKLKLAMWNGELKTMLRLRSDCTPDLTSLRGELLFVVGCDGRSFDHWYRVMHMDGRPVLKGTSLVHDMAPEVLASDAGDAFSVRTTRLSEDHVAGLPFQGADLIADSVRVYSAANGQRLFATDIAKPVPTAQTVAFAPGGKQLAVLDGEKISIFSVSR